LELIRGTHAVPACKDGSVVTIGTFDGVHLGHQALIGQLTAQAARRGLPAVLLTFEPMPREYFAPGDPPARLTTLRERLPVLAGLHVDYTWLLRFGEGLRNLSAEGFAEFLARELKARLVVVGHDFRFGKNGAASAPMLAASGKQLGFEVEVVAPVMQGGERISSSAVRTALLRADFAGAQRLLGRPYSMRARVVRGERLGRELGFPTANLPLKRRRAPLAGIFAVRVRGAGAGALPGVASLGTRPTIGGTEALLEAHVFDFNADLYGREIEVEFAAKIRDEECFATLAALAAQMQRDASAARRILGACAPADLNELT
jgi:riboflavin kinase/FMN adenylyltransferase